MKYLLNTPLAIHQLGQRQNQEDSIYPAYGQATAEQRLFILCDGMGGHSHGEVASGIVCQEVSKFVLQLASPNRAFPDAMLTAAMESMYNVLDANDDGSGKTMGTTMVFLYFHPGGVMAAHVGDSRYYHIRPSTREILYRSRDHSLVTELYEAGEIKLNEMATANGKNVIMRAVMPNKEERAMPDIVHIKDVQPGDWFYMCSDGMLEQMSDEEILAIFSDETLTPEQKRDCLLTATDANHDNHTAYLIRVQAVEHDAIDAAAPDDEQEARLRNKALLETFGLGPFAAASATTAQVVVDDMQTAAGVEPSTEGGGVEAGVVVEAVAPSATEEEPSEHTSAPVMPPPEPKNNKLYIIIGILAALIVLLVVCLFVFNNKSDKKDKPEPLPIRSTITYPSSDDDDRGSGDDGHSVSSPVINPSKGSTSRTATVVKPVTVNPKSDTTNNKILESVATRTAGGNTTGTGGRTTGADGSKNPPQSGDGMMVETTIEEVRNSGFGTKPAPRSGTSTTTGQRGKKSGK